MRFRNFPFDPARFRLFYGWIILGAGTTGILMSAPGQTVGVSVFTDPLIEALGLSRSALSLAYMVGTLGSAALLSRAGRLYDRKGARLVGTTAAVGLAVTLLYLSASATVSSGLEALLSFISPDVIAFTVIAVGFFLLRFTGQGALTLASRNMVMEWFEVRRGAANAIMGVAISFGFSMAPRVFEYFVSSAGWESAWRWIALLVAGFAVLAFLVFRDTPEAHGLRPDGGDVATRRAVHPEATAGRSFTLKQARGTYTFWLFAVGLLLGALVTTAYTFHIVSIFKDAGMARAAAVGVFFPTSIIAVAVQFAGSWLSDRIRLKYLFAVQMLGLTVMSAGVVMLAPGWPVVVVIAGHGLSQGIFGITANITWPRFFGRRHLGAVSGLAMALSVAGSAIGPFLFSAGHDALGSYAPAVLACGAVSAVLLVGAFFANAPSHPDDARTDL